MSQENPNAFKNWINPELVKKINANIVFYYPQFNQKKFLGITAKLIDLEMKDRVILIANTLQECLPKDYLEALKILLKSIETKTQSLKGFDLWPYTYFIEKNGTAYFKESLDALYVLTQKFTGEFAVRPFIAKDSTYTLNTLLKWSKDPNHHVRRWTSEGTRPRLPWGMKLHKLIENPKLTLPILENLKFDDELYVRKSVSNHLNDIAKDHPHLVIEILKNWQKQTKTKHNLEKINWIKKQALRTLVKDGNPLALKLMGVDPKVKVKLSPIKVNKKSIKLNEKLNFEFEVKSLSIKPQNLIIDYIVHYVKANNKTSAKVFKLKTYSLKKNESLKINKNHHFKHVTTRKHYSGLHKIEIQINGQIMGASQIRLTV